ncbi:MAG: thiol reductant ABC exporter subunit CydD [Actinobacteria bacterium]|nr:thiol reductant ABC exporter subunit CydD [Actinomycetota bacterium]
MPRPLDPRLLRYARGVRSLLIGSVAVAAGTAVLVVAQAFCLGDAISGVFIDGESLSDVLPVIGLLAAIVLGRALLSSAGDVLAQRMATRTSRELRAQLLAHVVRLGPVWLSGERRGQVATLATRGIDSVEPYVARYLPQLVIAVVVPITVGFAILTQDLLAAVLVAVTAPLIPVFMALIGMYTQSATAKQWSTLGVLSGHFLDVVAGLPTLKAFRREGAQSDRMAEVDRQYRKATMGVLRVSFLSSFALELLATLSVAIIAVAIGLRLVNGEMDLRTGLVVLILAPEVYLPIRQVGAQFHAAADGIDAAEQVFAVLGTEPATSGTRTDVPPGPVVVDGVSVVYPGSDLVSLAPVSLALEPGRVVAVVGPSGAGKTTLLAALQGFVAPSGGSITAGGVDLRDLDPATWRARLGVVAQDPVLVGPTVADDVRLRRPSASDAEVEAALRGAGLDPATLPAGAATRVGDLASDVSAGQRRRVALARVLLDRPPLVLLDEPTAGLDDIAESEVVSAVRRLAADGSAVVVVAHRPSLVEAGDTVVELSAAEVTS